MTTAYANGVAQGELKTLAEYAHRCALAFQPFLYLRDCPNAEIPRRRSGGDYQMRAHHGQSIERLNAEIKALQKTPVSEYRRQVLEREMDYFTTAMSAHGRNVAEVERMKRMRAEVVDWDVPGSFVELKTFMVQQLDAELKFRGDLKCPQPPQERDWEAARQEEIADREHEAAQHRASLEKIERMDEVRDAWVKFLWEIPGAKS